MYKHRDFDLLLHDDSELSSMLGCGVVSRETLREWPLSAVSRIDCADGSRYIYKSQRGEATEHDFYRFAHGDAIPHLIFGESEGEDHRLLLEYIDGESPEGLSRDELLRLYDAVGEAMQGIDYKGPYRAELNSSGFEAFSGELLAYCESARVAESDIAAVRAALSHDTVRRLISGRCTLLHGDLKCDNIIVTPAGEVTLIDWLNVSLGPEEIDLYSLLAMAGRDPVPFSGIGPELLRLALELHWLAMCRCRFMQDARFLDACMARIADNMRHIIRYDGYGGRGVYYFGG